MYNGLSLYGPKISIAKKNTILGYDLINGINCIRRNKLKERYASIILCLSVRLNNN